MDAWIGFFQGELGAAAALAGLLFVSVSMNQARILELGHMADRGLETLGMLFLVILTTSVSLIPGQPIRWLGGEILGLAALAILALFPVQQAYLRVIEPEHRRRARLLVVTNRLAMTLIALAGAVMAWRGDGEGVYLLPPGILLSFLAVGVNAWVLLIEISR